jgi:hypothetical protein
MLSQTAAEIISQLDAADCTGAARVRKRLRKRCGRLFGLSAVSKTRTRPRFKPADKLICFH